MPEATIEQQTLNGRVAPARTARVVGLGHKLPDRVVPNGPIAERIGVDAEWIVRRTGIRERRYAAPDERTTDLALAAARRALHLTDVAQLRGHTVERGASVREDPVGRDQLFAKPQILAHV